MTDNIWPPKSNTTPNSDAAPRRRGLSAETVQMIRKHILFGEPLPEQPRRSTQFQKGQSGNPKGRPRKRNCETVSVVTAQDKLFLQAARRGHRMMENGVEALMTGEEIVVKATMQAAVKGNPIAQKTFLDRAERAAVAEKKAIEEHNAQWRRYVEEVTEEIEEAKANGEPEPNPLPHPEDIVFEPGNYVRFCGPIDEAGWQRELEFVELIDTLILQYVHDLRCAPRTLANGEPNQAENAMIIARFLNEKLPKRLLLSEGDFQLRERNYKLMRRRALLKLAPKRWRAQGLHVRRGWIFPPFREYMQGLFAPDRDVKHYIRRLVEVVRQASMNISD